MSQLFDLPGPKDGASAAGISIDFDRIAGQAKAKSILERTIRHGRVGHAYLFLGPEGTGKNAMAIEFAKALNCLNGQNRPCQICAPCKQIQDMVYPDVKLVFPRPKDLKDDDHIEHTAVHMANPYGSFAYSATAEILIDHIRFLNKSASLRRHHATTRVFILTEAERMRTEAANSLLKLLEEPPAHLVLILTSSRREKLMPTIVSRCQAVYFAHLQAADITEALARHGVPAEKARTAAALAMGNLASAFDLARNGANPLREEAYRLLRAAAQDRLLDRLDVLEATARGKSRGEVKELFMSALSWLRDAQVLSLAAADSVALLHNSDQMNWIAEIEAQFRTALDSAIQQTEKAIGLLEKNVYINLILVNYLNQLVALGDKNKRAGSKSEMRQAF